LESYIVYFIIAATWGGAKMGKSSVSNGELLGWAYWGP